MTSMTLRVSTYLPLQVLTRGLRDSCGPNTLAAKLPDIVYTQFQFKDWDLAKVR